MQIRPARASDASTLSTVAVAAKQLWGYSPEDIERWRPQLTVSAAEITSHPTFVAELNSEVAGFYMLLPQQRAWVLEHFWIAPQFVRRGIGRALLAHAANTARLGGASTLAIDADPNAEEFYLACGAIREGSVAAPTTSDPARIRPQLSLQLLHAA